VKRKGPSSTIAVEGRSGRTFVPAPRMVASPQRAKESAARKSTTPRVRRDQVASQNGMGKSSWSTVPVSSVSPNRMGGKMSTCGPRSSSACMATSLSP
jgi:hypothetical protein